MNDQLLSPSQHDTWLRYRRMWNRLVDQLSRELSRETGLSEADFDIMMGLLEAEGQPIRAIALRCGLEWEKSRLSHQLRRMEQRGLVRKEVCLEDNRGTVIVLTETGKYLAVKARQVHDETLQRHLFDVVSSDQIDALGDIAETVLARLEARHVP